MRRKSLCAAICEVLYYHWVIEDAMRRLNAPKKLTTEWEELKQEVIAAPIAGT